MLTQALSFETKAGYSPRDNFSIDDLAIFMAQRGFVLPAVLTNVDERLLRRKAYSR
jgi:hypothetical protein